MLKWGTQNVQKIPTSSSYGTRELIFLYLWSPVCLVKENIFIKLPCMNSSCGFWRQSIADLTKSKKPNKERDYQSRLMVSNMAYEFLLNKKNNKNCRLDGITEFFLQRQPNGQNMFNCNKCNIKSHLGMFTESINPLKPFNPI